MKLGCGHESKWPRLIFCGESDFRSPRTAASSCAPSPSLPPFKFLHQGRSRSWAWQDRGQSRAGFHRSTSNQGLLSELPLVLLLTSTHYCSAKDMRPLAALRYSCIDELCASTIYPQPLYSSIWQNGHLGVSPHLALRRLREYQIRSFEYVLMVRLTGLLS